MGIGEEKTVVVEFDPAYKADNHIRLVEETLTIAYKEHPHVVSLHCTLVSTMLLIDKQFPYPLKIVCLIVSLIFIEYLNEQNIIFRHMRFHNR